MTAPVVQDNSAKAPTDDGWDAFESAPPPAPSSSQETSNSAATDNEGWDTFGSAPATIDPIQAASDAPPTHQTVDDVSLPDDWQAFDAAPATPPPAVDDVKTEPSSEPIDSSKGDTEEDWNTFNEPVAEPAFPAVDPPQDASPATEPKPSESEHALAADRVAETTVPAGVHTAASEADEWDTFKDEE